MPYTPFDETVTSVGGVATVSKSAVPGQTHHVTQHYRAPVGLPLPTPGWLASWGGGSPPRQGECMIDVNGTQRRALVWGSTRSGTKVNGVWNQNNEATIKRPASAVGGAMTFEAERITGTGEFQLRVVGWTG